MQQLFVNARLLCSDGVCCGFVCPGVQGAAGVGSEQAGRERRRRARKIEGTSAKLTRKSLKMRRLVGPPKAVCLVPGEVHNVRQLQKVLWSE